MSAITLANLGWSAPDGTPVLTGLDFSFTRERIGLVGRNGIGKSTLLALIDGRLPPRSGSVTIGGAVATLLQTVQFVATWTIADLFETRQSLALLARAEAGDATIEELADCDWTLPARIAEALAAMALDAPPETPLAQLSGGQRTRAALAAALFARPDFLLLDEPTNHLDADGRDALVALLAQWRAGAIVVSHDRTLLEQMDAIAELSHEGLRRYGGNYSAYRLARDQELAAARQALDHAARQSDQIAGKIQTATERKQRRDGAGARKGAKGDMPRILIGQRKNQAQASAAGAVHLADRQRRDAADAQQAARAKLEITERIAIALPPTGVVSGQRMVTLDHVTAGHDPARPILRDMSLTIIGPERVAITGPNGSGKSTLMQVVAGTLAPLSGTISRPVPSAMLDQGVSLLDADATIAENFARLHPGATRNAVHAALARFRFRADLALQRVGTLSGGEQLRAGLACVLGGEAPPPLLLLDEPSNHLDLASLEAIESILNGYDGALVVISHDRAFLDAIRIDRTIALPQ